MTKRIIQTTGAPTVVVRAGGGATIEGWDQPRVEVEADNRWGLKVEQREADIEVTAGGSCVVKVPEPSILKVYTGKGAEIRDIQGEVAALNVGGSLTTRQVRRLAGASSGRKMDIECDDLIGGDVKFSCGGDLRFHLRNLHDARFMIDDLGGYWEIGFGEQTTRIRLKSGGDVTLVTDQEPSQMPNIVGSIEKPDVAAEPE